MTARTSPSSHLGTAVPFHLTDAQVHRVAELLLIAAGRSMTGQKSPSCDRGSSGNGEFGRETRATESNPHKNAHNRHEIRPMSAPADAPERARKDGPR